MRHILLLLLLGFAFTFTSCRDDFEFETSSGTGLEFSRDTVYLDTVFSNIGSSTYTLKVYNRSNKDISIPSIRLRKGDASKYRLMVDGVPGKSFSNVELLAKDSMYVFIETTANIADANATDFLYTDEIDFVGSAGTQDVNLVTLIQDAYFLYPQRNELGQYEAVRYDDELTDDGEEVYIYGFNLNEAENDNELHFNNTKPYVIYGYATVPDGKTLVVDPGARVHFHADSGLMVRPGATLNINGAASVTPDNENEVVFEGDRLEPDFAETSGQWGAILLMSDKDNVINHLTLKNATVGIISQRINAATTPKLQINNSQIYNCTNYGLLSYTSNISGENTVVNNSGQASVALVYGGQYDFKHCTFANYFNSYNQVPLLINNYIEDADGKYAYHLNASFGNCIVYGSGNVGMSLDRFNDPAYTYTITFTNSLLKLIDTTNQLKTNELYPGDSGTGNNPTLVAYNNCQLARTSTRNKPAYQDPQNNKLNLFTNTSIDAQYPGPENTADATIAAQVPFDITGASRPSGGADIGAYESRPEPAE
ncbi:hypothetical protein [Flavobacterium subsaxonicum]|uniref:Right handed beta helix domain-containing protein n=1 Tax=Flavobacterium subsaxonicum WB 4.1-42 = DSM 21790 TaxID=1121898 RepID=A0A0A2MVQ4_9FLAO|nr:hypothetical protein [Flavobacterium subsaxonicum]KGO92305.1 hypothetical protein Q766_12600 [Flavobacterium subsaxonicum WB 4.1-42 = DSM 21790]